jgi:hypothetical protein
VRDETVELWNALQNTGGNSLSVDGPPGTGKSTEAWAWALWKAKKDKVTVTWYHLTKNELVKVVIDGESEQITTGYQADINDIKNSEGSILIVDGVIASKSFDVRSACCNWRRSEKGRRFILVSSVSVTVALQENKEAKIVDFTVASWTFKQYQDACANEDFFRLVLNSLKCQGLKTGDDKDQLLLAKYYFAGDCARWMFEFTYDEWLADFNMHLQKVTNYAILFGGGGGDETNVAVNHLRGVTLLTSGGIKVKKYFFISQYAAGELAKKCDNKKREFLIDSYAKAKETQNPAFEGWIFEFDVDYQLEQAHKQKLKFCSEIRPWTPDGTSTKEQRSVDKYMVFNSVDLLRTTVKSLEADKVLWAKPTLWCQKAYDFLCIWKVADTNDLNMVVVNATLAKKHSVLLDEVKKLATELCAEDCVISAIRFDFIVPKGAEFTIGEITGRLCEWKNLQGSLWPNAPTAASYTDCLAVAEVSRTS